MEISVDDKIKAAIEPLLERISLLQADNQRFKEEIAALQTQPQSKTNQKPTTKPSLGHPQRPQTVKGGRKQTENHEVKPDIKNNQRGGPKKEEVKVQQEESKVQADKAIVAKGSSNNSKPSGALNTNKDTHEPKNIKAKPTTASGLRPSFASNNNKPVTDKKLTNKNETEPQKKQEVTLEDKIHTSQQKQHKTNSTHGVKSPVVNKPKPEKHVDKKAIVPPSPALNHKKQPTQKQEPKPLKGGKSKPETQPVKEEISQPETKVEQGKTQIQTSTENLPKLFPIEALTVEESKSQTAQVIADEPKVQEKEQVKEQVKPEIEQKVVGQQGIVLQFEHKQQEVTAHQQVF